MNIRSVEFRQLAMLGVLSSVLSFVFSGLEVLYTLYAINIIKVSASEWSQIRGYRYILMIVIVLVLGTYAGRIGHKKTAAITVALMLCNLLLFVIQPSKLFLFITLPIHVAFISMITMLLQLVYLPLFICSLGNILFGLQSSVVISVILFMVTNALNAISFASVSMWTSRMVFKEQLGFAFTMHKVLIGLFGLFFSIVLAYMETVIGIDHCMIYMGIVGCIFSVLLGKEMKVQQRVLY